ncbi:MAG: helix-turn-helix domain-containing protein [Lysobacterales bacterium]
MRQRYGFLLIPGYSLLSLASATEVLRVADELVAELAIDVLLLSRDGRPVPAAGGESMSVSGALHAALLPALSGLFVVSERLPGAGDAAALAELAQHGRQLDRQRGLLGGLGTGAAWLAEAGLLNGYRCTVPVLHTAELAARCPQVIVSQRLYELDRNRLSGAGAGALDLMIHWLGLRHGERLTRQLLAHFGLERLRAADDHQVAPDSARLGGSAKLAEAVALMEANLSEPLSTEDIAQLVGVSRRQLERLFKQHLDTLPSRWYLEQRLERARRLLQRSSQSILQIGLSCGFTSGAHFSNAYRNCFGRTPRDERSARAAAWREAGPTATGGAADAQEDLR